MSIIVEDEGVPHSTIKIFSRGSLRDLGCLQLLRRFVPFKRPVYEKGVETFSRLAGRR